MTRYKNLSFHFDLTKIHQKLSLCFSYILIKITNILILKNQDK